MRALLPPCACTHIGRSASDCLVSAQLHWQHNSIDGVTPSYRYILHPPSRWGQPFAAGATRRRRGRSYSHLHVNVHTAMEAAEESATRALQVVCRVALLGSTCFRTSRRGGNTLRASPNAVDATPQRTRGHK